MRATPPPPIGQTEPYTSEWDRTEAARAGQSPWLRNRRRAARDRFVEAGFPGTRVEDWRFTNIAPIAESRFTLAAPRPITRGDLAAWTFAGAAAELVFVNGHYVPALSVTGGLPAGVVAGPLAAALAADGPARQAFGAVVPSPLSTFPALNTAFFAEGAFVLLPPHTVLEGPIHLLFVTTADARAVETAMTHPRVLIVAGEDSQARIVESYAGTTGATYFTNALTEVSLGAHAVVEHCRVQRESEAAFHVGLVHVDGARSSTFTSHAFALGGALVRNEIAAVMNGEGMECTLNGLYLATGGQLIDNHTTIDHATPHCSSHEVYKGVLGGRARGVFNGKIIVRPDAQKTDAKQTNRALLLSDDAVIDTKPQLEIFANDVKCTHGAAIGQLDDDAVFYLRSRAIGEADARTMLIHAFAGEVLDRVGLAAVREPLRAELTARLSAVLAPAGGRP
ncbi:MAG: Fe-S cluster assembly protein SufD [Acidobacteriota bacterium]|nr:Fe-S cluster assembly protein SufD [Acidobacteriota bacterium]